MTPEVGTLVLLTHFASTVFMVGVIWFVQVVHYPLMAVVGRDASVAYELAHTRLTTWVVGPAMLIELGTGVLLAWVRPPNVSSMPVAAGLGLLAVVWLSTQFVQVPCHTRLSVEFDSAVHGRLVRTNWVRTAVWSARGVLVLLLVWATT